MSAQPERYEGKWWIINGIIFGIILLIIVQVIMPLLYGEHIDLTNVTTRGLPIYLVGGLMYGLTMKLVYKYLYPTENIDK